MMYNYFSIQHCQENDTCCSPWLWLIQACSWWTKQKGTYYCQICYDFLLQVVASVIGSRHAQASLIKGLLESRSRGLGSIKPWQASCIKERICSCLTVNCVGLWVKRSGFGTWLGQHVVFLGKNCDTLCDSSSHRLQTNVMTRAQLFEGWLALTNG